MRLVPDDCRRRFFKKAVDVEVWQAKPILSEWLRFRRHNLMQPLRETPFDLVVIKNVLIYFDTESKKKVLGHLLPLVRPGGYLLCGAAEGVNDLLGDLTKLRPWLHRRA
jgi:chemotaxis protein methyltransferase CheR